jgi:6-phosphofructokinase 1
MKNGVYLQSGGPTAVINSSFFGVIKACFEEQEKIHHLYGSRYGIDGLINDHLVLLDQDLSYYEKMLDLDGALLGSARIRLHENDERFSDIVKTINKYHIGYIFINGGNDSMDTADKLNKYFQKNHIDCVVMGIPKTVDNDLVLTDHTPGFGSSCKYVVKTIMDLSLDLDSYKKGKVTICEIMGRDAGWLTGATYFNKKIGLGPDLIYLPENIFDKEKFLQDVMRVYQEKNKVFICIAESLKDKHGDYIFAQKTLDSFNHVQLGNLCKYLCDLVQERLNLPTRAIELSLMQRCSSYIKSKIDVQEAIQVGYLSVKYALKHKIGMVAIIRDDTPNYQVHYDVVPLDKVANAAKAIPNIYFNQDGSLNDKFISYIYPFLDYDEIKVDKIKLSKEEAK